MLDRINRLRGYFEPAEIDAFYITNPENRYYLSGFSGTTGALLLTGEQAYLLTDFRYTAQAAMESPAFQVVEVRDSYAGMILKIFAEKKLRRLGIEGEHLTCNQYSTLTKLCEGIEVKPQGDKVEQLRICKDESEVKLIEKAVSIADQALVHTLPLIKPGVSENEVSLHLEYSMRRLGSEGSAFKIIAASGARAALAVSLAGAGSVMAFSPPHPTVAKKPIKKATSQGTVRTVCSPPRHAALAGFERPVNGTRYVTTVPVENPRSGSMFPGLARPLTAYLTRNVLRAASHPPILTRMK